MNAHLVFLLEEPSAASFLRQVTARLKLDKYYDITYRTFEGKNDLEKRLESFIRLWAFPKTRFIIMRDADSGDCREIKQKLVSICKSSGKGKDCIVRIACKELESFYLGDLAAVGRALSLPKLGDHQMKSKFRAPDNLGCPSQELILLTKNRYSKVNGSKRIGAEISLGDINRSTSFRVLLQTLQQLREEAAPGPLFE